MADIKTGWERDNRTHFDKIILNYDKVRHGYPKELIDYVLGYCNSDSGKKAVEIGAGTGKATVPFLDAGYDVTAVEAGENMAEFLMDKFNGNKNFRVINTTFEDVSLDENSFDLIYAASAFHWVDAEIGCPKAYRLLKNNGVIALMRYNIVSSYSEELRDEINSVYDKYYHSYYGERTERKKYKEMFLEPAEIMRGYGFEDLADYGFSDVSNTLYDVPRTFGADEYIDWLDTMADHRNLPDSDRASLYSGVRDAILRHNNQYTINFVFQLYMGRKVKGKES